MARDDSSDIVYAHACVCGVYAYMYMGTLT